MAFCQGGQDMTRGMFALSAGLVLATVALAAPGQASGSHLL